jgi:hypothetical protein
MHLICLRCNRANAAESKFCSECGAGLLRKFCSGCHALNDAQSHFCQLCGAVLPVLPAQGAAPLAATAAPAGEVPDLTDIAYPESDQVHRLVSAPLLLDPGAIVAVAPSQLPALPAKLPQRVAKAIASPYRAPVLLGFAGVAALLMVALLWPRSESQRLPSEVDPMRAPSSNSAGQGAAGMAALPALTEAAVPPPKPASTSSDRALEGPTRALALPPLPGLTTEPDKMQPRLTPTERILAVRPPAAGPTKAINAAEHARPAAAQQRPRPAAPAPECTPQVDALALCAPGAKVTGR